ncbi:MAG TPA: hypothetical protein VGM67_05530 [Gemmatimonadaceae bacterium]|jgi:hypothetical protein
MKDQAIAVMAVAFFGMIAVCVTSIVSVWGKRIESKSRSLPTNMLEARLERIESAVDVIAVEVERIAESQRFAVRLAVEKGASPAIAPPSSSGGKTVTPH